MEQRITGLETEYALLHFPDTEKTGLTGTEIFAYMDKYLEKKDVARLYEEKFLPDLRTVFPQSSSPNQQRFALKKNRMFLANGARFYLDTGDHPEFATPECRSALDAMVYEKTGERFLEDLRAGAEKMLHAEGIGGTVDVFKNNFDSRGNTFGCHENYLIPRQCPREGESSFFKLIIREMIPFLISRIILCGSGKLLSGNNFGFQISQRADFIDSDLSSDTTFRRGIINSRDEPLSKIDTYRRLHILLGDSCLSEMASFIKIGTAMLILRVIEEDGFDDCINLADPIMALREFSADPTCKVQVRTESGKYISAVELQQYYLDKTKSFYETKNALSGETKVIIDHWQRLLNALSSDPDSVKYEIDWLAKKALIDRYLKRNNLSTKEISPWVFIIKRLKGLDLDSKIQKQNHMDHEFNLHSFLEQNLSKEEYLELEQHARHAGSDLGRYFYYYRHFHNLMKMDIIFHNITSSRSLFYKMRAASSYKFSANADILDLIKDRFPTETAALDEDTIMEELYQSCRQIPPQDTRAKIRSDYVKAFYSSGLKGSVNWDNVTYFDESSRKINLMNPFVNNSLQVDELIREISTIRQRTGR